MKSQLVDQFGLRDALIRSSRYAPWPTLILDRQFRVVSVNPAAREMLNAETDISQGMFFPEIVAEESLACFEQFLECCFSTKPSEKISFPFQCLLRSFEHREDQKKIEIQAEVLKDRDELSLVLYLSDSSQNSRTGKAVLERDQWYRSILDNTGAVIYIKDTQGRYQFVNRLFEETFHVAHDEIYGKTDYDLFSKETADRFRRIDEQVYLSGETERVQEIVPQDDRLHHYISVKFPLYNVQRELTGIAGISTDITEQIHTQQELKAAQAVQKLLYPESAPEVKGYDIAGRVSPAEKVSGDYYDYIWLSPDRLVIAVGDVSGHGLGPALEMVETRSYLRAILRTEVRLDVAMECLNEFLYRDLRDSAFVTLFLAELDFKTNSFKYVGAGHQAELLKSDGSCIRLKSTGLMLGIDSQVKYSCSACYLLQAGDLLLISTDGITEAMSPEGEMFGYEEKLSLLQTHQHRTAWEVVNELIDQAGSFPGLARQADDMTAVAVKKVPDSG